MSTFDKVKELLANQLNVDKEKITMESNVIADLGADSLDLFEILIALEDEFSVTVSEDKVNDIKTVGQLVEYIDEAK